MANNYTLVSRYGIIPNDLRIHALTLNLGEGQANRFLSPDTFRFILDAERNIEEQVSDFIAVPLLPTPNRPGLTLPTISGPITPTTPPPFPPPDPTRSFYSPEVAVTPYGTKWEFPVEFIQAIIFNAIAIILRSEYFEVEPNVSQIAVEADTRSSSYLFLFRTRPTVLVGAGRRRNPNPHMPPNISPRGNFNIGPPGGGGR